MSKFISQRLLVLLLLILTQFGYSQLAVEQFESGVPPLQWAVGSTVSPTPANNWISTPAGGGYQSTIGAMVNPALNATVGATAEYFLITKQFPAISNGEIRFYTKQGSFAQKGTTYQVRISLASQPDLSSFNVTLATYTETQLNAAATTYEEKIIPFPNIAAGTPVYLAFVAITNQTGIAATAGDTWFVDNARVIPACTQVAPPTTVTSATSATISWTHPNATQFGIAVVPSGAGPGAIGTPVTGFTYTTTTPLTPSTTYDVYIKTNCDSTTSSAWAGPFPFTTAQVGLTCPTAINIPDVTTTPYILNSNLNQYYTETDYTPYTTIGSNCFPPSSNPQNQLNGNHLFLNYTPTNTGLINITQAVSVASGGGGNNCFNDLSSIMVFDGCANVGVSCIAAATTGPNHLTAQISDLYVEAGHTYVIVVSSPFPHAPNSNAGICFTLTVSGATCPAPSPSGTTYSNLTQTGGNFSWNNVGGIVNSWQYVALPVSAGPPTPSTPFTTTTNNLNNIVSGLSAATTYNLYIRPLCGTPATLGNWSAPFPFTTPCNVFTPPYYTGFSDTDATLACWSQLNLNNDVDFFHFGMNANSEPVAKLRTNNAGNTTNDMLISPQFHLVSGDQQRLRFKYTIYGNWGSAANPTPGPGSFEVKLSTTGVGAQSFTETVIPLTSYTTGYNSVEAIVPLLDTSADVNIAWIVPPGATQAGNWIYIDNVYIEDLPACSEPSYPVVTPGTLTSDSVEISWTNGFGNTQWELVAQPLGTGIPTTDGIIVDTNPYTLTGLDPSTQYEFYMRAYCSDTEQSIWVGPINFNTLCVPQPTPYYESLNNDDPTTKKFCWTTNNQNADAAKWTITAAEAMISPQGTFITPFASYNDWLISVPVNAIGAKRVRFKYKVLTSPNYPSQRGNFEVLMSPTPDFSTYTVLIPAHDFTNMAYMEDSAIFMGTGPTYFAFRLPPTMTDPSQTGTVMVDDFVVEDAPACTEPADLAATNITQHTANLSWTAGLAETQWQIVVQLAGQGVPTGDGTTVNIAPAYNATGLPQDTLHEFYVRAICNAPDISEWVGPFTFKTSCEPLPTPFTETFDSNSVTESCWSVVNANGDSQQWNLNQPVNPIFGNQMASLNTSTNGNNNEWMITPTLSAHAGQRLRFYYKAFGLADRQEDLKVRLSTNGADITQFSNILYENNLSTTTNATGTVAGSNTITVASVQGIEEGDVMYIPGYPFPYLTTVTDITGTTITLSANATLTQPGVQHVEFKHETINNIEAREMVINLDDITSDTDINIAFQTPFYPQNPWNYRGAFLYIDNVIIEDIPECPSVINVTSTNLIDTAVALNWESTGSEGSWEISVQPYGTPAPTGNTLPEYLHTTTSHPFTVTDLIPATQYQYYIRAICSDSSQSVWVGPFEFTTRCDFNNLCMYTISTISGNTGEVDTVNVMQNGVVVQPLTFPGFGQTIIETQVYLCSGVAFNLNWDGSGSGLQYSQAQIIIKDEANNVIWTSPLGLGTINTDIYTGFSSCGVIDCAQPTNLTVNNQGVLSWTPGGSETQWEVFVQPLNNGTIPSSGTTVTSPNYTPSAGDFVDASAGTYEYFVRAICGDDNTSFWSGPYVFIRNDEPANAVHLTPNTGTDCAVSAVDASFIGATTSAVPTTCAGINGGDIWYDFVATAKVHIIELSDFGPGSYYDSSYEGPWPKIMMSLYEEQAGGILVEKGCSENNSFVTVYSSELVIGNTYKIRLKLDSMVPNNKKFHICITTPDACDLDAFNYDFEKLPMQTFTSVATIIDAVVVPGWRVNTDWGTMFFVEGSSGTNVPPYSGGQCIQLIHDDASEWDPTSPNIEGLYKDFDTSEIPVMNYSFASATRIASGSGTTVQLFAGPPSGPFTLVTEDAANNSVWELVQGTYNVPPGQNTTRFIFRVKNYAIGHMLDAANFTANTDINIDTASTTLDCTTTQMEFDATGIGHWEADATNPALTTIASPNTGSTNVSGFSAPGSYIFHWISRYCDKTVTITKQGPAEVPVVTNPTEYCLNEPASPLVATVPSEYTVNWYTQPIGGIATTVAPTPSTAVAGNTQLFYAAAVDASGCEGARAEIVVQVYELPSVTITGTTTVCEGATATVTFNGTPNATVGYTVNAGQNQTIILDENGMATVTTEALTANASYDLVDVTSSGTHPCEQTQTGNALITVETLPTVSISGTTIICAGSTATIGFNGTANATVTYTVDGGPNQTVTLDGTGTATVVTPALTTDSTYTLVSITSAGTLACNQTQTGSAVITVEALPTATISGTASICTGATAVITFTGTPNATVTYTVDGGANQTIILDASGLATISAAFTANTTYSLVSVTSSTAASCNALVTGSVAITVNQLAAPTLTFSYDTACVNATRNPTFAPGFATGGIFSSATATVDPVTGAVTAATVGSHDVTYTLAANTATCTDGGSFTASIVISTGITPVTGFSYDALYCANAANALPSLSANFTTGGTFSSSTGLSIVNQSTGEISPSQSTAGTYTVTYTVAADPETCNTGGSTSFVVTIASELTFLIDPVCENSMLILKVTDADFTVGDVTWMQGSNTVGTGETFNVDNYMASNPTLQLPLTFTAVTSAEGCDAIQSHTVETNHCRVIPRGISPNDDQMNDSFDLTGYGVNELSIFNRYGMEVFSYKGLYTNQWKGQTDKGEDLPDGTYFYSIHTTDGSTITGWVYINREY